MSQIKTLDKTHIIPDNHQKVAELDNATGDVSTAAIQTLTTRSPLARAAYDKGTTGNKHFASKLPYCEHTDGDANTCLHTNMSNSNPSDDTSLSCGNDKDDRNLLQIACRKIIYRLHQSSRMHVKGWRKGMKKPPRAYYKFYKPTHLWHLRIYQKEKSAIRPVPHLFASSCFTRKSDHGLFAHLYIRDELSMLDNDPATTVQSWRNRFNVFGQLLEHRNYALSLMKQIEVHSQDTSRSLYVVIKLMLSVAKLVLLCFQRYVVTPIFKLVLLDMPESLEVVTPILATPIFELVSMDSLDTPDISCPDCSLGMVAPSSYHLEYRQTHHDMMTFLRGMAGTEKLFSFMNAGPNSSSLLEKIPVLQLTKSANADNTRKWCDQVEDAFEIMFAESDNWRYLTEGRPITSQAVQARTAALRAVEAAAASYTSADAYTTALIEAQSKLTEANLKLEDVNLRMWQALYSRISKASRDEMSLRFTAIYEAMKDRKDLPLLYHLAIVVHSFPAMQEKDMFDQQLKVVLNLKMADTETNAIEWNKSFMQHLELLAYSYDLAYPSVESDQGASNPLASKLFSTSSSTSVCISRIDWPYLRYAYLKALNIDYFMMLDSPADKDKFHCIVMTGSFKSLMEEVVMWMERERIQNRGKYSHPRDRIPGRTLATSRTPTVAFSATEDLSDYKPASNYKQSDKHRGRTVSRSHSYRDRSRSLSTDSREPKRFERRRSASNSSADSITREKAQRNYKAQSTKHGSGPKYDSRLDSKAPAIKCEYCSLVHKHDQKRLQWITHTLSDCRSLRKHTEQGNVHPDWKPTQRDKTKRPKSYANVSLQSANKFCQDEQLVWTQNDHDLLAELGVSNSLSFMSRSTSSVSKELKALNDALSPPYRAEQCCQVCFSTPLELIGERCSVCGQYAARRQLEELKRKRTPTSRYADIPASFSAAKIRMPVAPPTPAVRIRNADRRSTSSIDQERSISQESAEPWKSIDESFNPIMHSLWPRYIDTDPRPDVAARLKDALCTVECGVRKLDKLVDGSACLHTRLANDLRNSLQNSLFECFNRYHLYRDTLLTMAYTRSEERFVPQSPTDIPPNRPELAERSPASPILLSDSSDSTLVDTPTISQSNVTSSSSVACNSTDDSEDIGPCDLLLDSGTTHHLLSMNLARILNVTLAILPSPHTFHGVGGIVTATHFGHLCAFRQCFFCEYGKNLISMSFLQRQDFMLTFTLSGIRISHPDLLPDGLEFKLRGGLYIHSIPCRVSEELKLSRVYTVTSYTPDQIRLAKLMRKFHEDTGHRSPREERNSSVRGGITGAPVINAQLQNLTNAILGPCAVCVMGKSVAAVKIRRPLRERSSTIGSVQHIDMFFLKCRVSKANIPHWIFVDEASANAFVWHCTDRTKNSFREALSQVTGYYLRFNHAPPKTLISDGEGAVAAYEDEFNSVGGQVHFVARNQHVALAECYIGKLKTIMRTILAAIPFKWPTCFFTYLVDEAVQLFRLRATARSDGVPLCELVEHRKPDFSRISHRFGDYVLAVTPADNRVDDLSPRADPAIILHRPFHGILVYTVYLLNTRGIARRRGLKAATIIDAVVDSINAISNAHISIDESIQSAEVPTLDSNELADMEVLETEIEQLPVKEPTSAPEIIYLHANQKPGRKPKYSRVLEPQDDLSIPTDEAVVDTQHIAAPEDTFPSDPVIEDTPKLFTAEPEQIVPETEAILMTDTASTTTEMLETRPTRIRKKPERYSDSAFHLNEDLSHALGTIGYDSSEYVHCLRAANAASKGNYNLRAAAKKDPSRTVLASEQEFQTLLDKDTFRPVHRHQLTEEQNGKTIIGFTFLKQKLHVDGSLDRWKARFVAGGHMVDASQLGPLHSSTVQLTTVFLLFSLAAQFGWKISNTDVTAAYLNTRLPVNQRIPMLMGKEETVILLKLKPEWSEYVNRAGSMLVLIYGGIYGLPQSALLWYNRLVAVFLDLGYFVSDSDQACFIRIGENHTSVLIIHVDDILHFYTSPADESNLQKRLKREFGNVTSNATDVGIYLGIEYTFQRKDKSVFLHMSKYIAKLLADANIQRQRPAPCTESFIRHDKDSPRCDQHTFASGVMSLYYLAMRTRPDIQVYTSFLASKIHDCTETDLRKLFHLYAFLNQTKDRGITLRSTGTTLHFSMDASYNIHSNCRSHSGLHVTLGNDELPRSPYGGPIAVLSHVQKFVASSSTEAEIIAVFVYHQHILALRSLMMNLGFDQKLPSLIHQDNQAAITIFARGLLDKGSTRHLQMRIARIHELITDGIIKFVYCSTDDMQADAPSKPLHSKQDMQKLLRLCNSDV